MANCNHRKYYNTLIDLVASSVIDPAQVLTRMEPMHAVIDAYQAFDQRQPSWIKVALRPRVL